MMNRRKVLSQITGAAMAPPLVSAAFDNPKVEPSSDLSLITLGNTGIKTTRLAQGTGSAGVKRKSKQVDMGFRKFTDLLKHAYDRGVRFYDLADQYGSHFYFREALRTIPREKITILSKLQFRFDSPRPQELSISEQRRFAKNAIERFRLELQVDVIDIMLLHNVVSETWDSEMPGYMEVLSEYKEKGVITALGMSCHTIGALKRSSELDWVEVALTRINPYGKVMDGPLDEVMPIQQKFKDRGAAVIGMKIFGAGQLVGKRDECMKFAQSLSYLDAMTIGAQTPSQIDDNIQLMKKYPVRS
jgi:aryl-alcohol dehydrogenase-like predicted oxidoreductase